MKNRIELRWPKNGISDDQAHSKQLPGTTPYAKNVRSLHRGRAQGAQRPGWRDFGSQALVPGHAVDAIASVSVDLSKIQYFGPGDSEILRVWGHKVPGLREAPAVDVDLEGNLYVLDAAGSFQKIGADGEVAIATTFYVPQFEEVVPRIMVDRSGNVYVGTSHPQGFSGRVLKFERLEDGEDDVAYAQAWEHTGLFGVRDFRVYAGALAIARFFSAQTQDGAPADVVVLGTLFAPEPTEFYTAATPWPVSTIDMNDQGEVVGCSPANSARTDILGDEGWRVPVELYTLHELGDVTGLQVSTQFHFWVDAKTLSETHVDGTRVIQVPDRRWLQSSLDFAETEAISESDGALSGGQGGVYVPPTDTTPRMISQDGPRDSHGWVIIASGLFLSGAGARNVWFRPTGAGNSPSIQFTGDAQSFLWTSAGLSYSGVKSDSDGDGVIDQEGLMPQVGSVVPAEAGVAYTTFIVFRYNVNEDNSEVVWMSQCRWGAQFALIMNADTADVYTAAGATAGSLTLMVTDIAGNSMARKAVASHAIVSADMLSSAAADPLNTLDNTQRVAIACIHHAGGVDDGLAADGDHHSMFRVNGRTIDTFDMKTSRSSGFLDTLGGSIGGYNIRAFQDAGHMKTMNGHILEVLTVLGTTATPGAGSPNDTELIFPGQPNAAAAPAAAGAAAQFTDMKAATGWAGAADGEYDDDPAVFTSVASDIEKVEGLLAHKWGCSNVLPGGADITLAQGGIFQNAHPFGDAPTAPFGARPPVGSPTAGGVALTSSAQALLSPKELLFKVGASGKVAWALAGGGHGLGVKAGRDGTVIAVGRHDTAAGETVVAKRVRDLGSTVRATGEDTWALEDLEQPIPQPVVGMAVDDAGNLYWPRLPEKAFSRFQVKAVPTVTQHVIRITNPVGAAVPEQNYWLRATFSGLGFNEVLRGANITELGTNIVAAINDTGVDTGANRQYEPRDRSEYYEAFLEIEGSDVFVKLVRRNLPGAAKFTLFDPIAPHVTFEWTEISLLATQDKANNDFVIMGLDSSNRRVEVRSAENGTLLWSKAYPSSSEDDLAPLAIAFDPDLPLYPNDDPLEGVPEHVYVGQRGNVGADGVTVDSPIGDNVQKLRQVERRQIIGVDKSPRRTVHVATCNGDLFEVARGKTPQRVNNGHGVFNNASPFAKLFPYREKVYGLDGQSYIRFNPKTRLVEEWKAEGSGKIPYGAKLGCVWNGRIVLARTADDPHNVHMSERGNADGWDTDPSVITPLTAFSGASTGNLHFKKSDLVNCLIPARDDRLIMGGDQSISLLRGDPGSGGDLDNISTGEGLAFGDAYAIGPSGTVFVKTINGGILRIGVDGSLDRISLRFIERRLQDVNLNEYDIRMAWNFDQEGLHVFQVPKGIGGRIIPHWFWDAKENGWWEDEFAVTDLQPTAVAVLDGDHPDDRRVVMGCEDGRMRYEDETAANDGDHRIVSEVAFWPLVPGGAPGRVRFSHLEATLSSFGDSVDVQVFTDDVSDIVAGRDARYTGSAGPGYRGYNMFQIAGNQAGVMLRNGALDEKWALDSLFIRAKQVGKRRRF